MPPGAESELARWPWETGSGTRLHASRDAGLLPAPRLPSSQLTLASANDERTITDGQPRSTRGTPDPVLRALTQA